MEEGLVGWVFSCTPSPAIHLLVGDCDAQIGCTKELHHSYETSSYSMYLLYGTHTNCHIWPRNILDIIFICKIIVLHHGIFRIWYTQNIIHHTSPKSISHVIFLYITMNTNNTLNIKSEIAQKYPDLEILSRYHIPTRNLSNIIFIQNIILNHGSPWYLCLSPFTGYLNRQYVLFGFLYVFTNLKTYIL